jgi:hypothetical protein
MFHFFSEICILCFKICKFQRKKLNCFKRTSLNSYVNGIMRQLMTDKTASKYNQLGSTDDQGRVTKYGWSQLQITQLVKGNFYSCAFYQTLNSYCYKKNPAETVRSEGCKTKPAPTSKNVDTALGSWYRNAPGRVKSRIRTEEEQQQRKENGGRAGVSRPTQRRRQQQTSWRADRRSSAQGSADRRSNAVR